MFRRERRMSKDTSLLDEARDCAARNPKRAFELESRHVAAYPEDSTGYFHRHFSWIRLGAYDKAMQDCETAIRPNAKPVMFMARGDLYRLLGDHARAVEDFTRARDLNYEDWLTSFGPHHRAGSLARLGRLEDALADCDPTPRTRHRRRYRIVRVFAGDRHDAHDRKTARCGPRQAVMQPGQ